MTSDLRVPYVWGDTRATMAGTKGSQPARGSQSHKTGLSPDRSLQLDFLKLESLVTVNQPCHGEYVPGSCTHRPSTHGRQERPKHPYPVEVMFAAAPHSSVVVARVTFTGGVPR